MFPPVALCPPSPSCRGMAAVSTPAARCSLSPPTSATANSVQASDDGTNINGAILASDGGWSAL